MVGRRAAAVPAVFGLLTACDTPSCHLIGCSGGLAIDVGQHLPHAGARVRVCASGDCVDEPLGRATVVDLARLHTTGPRHVTVIITGFSAASPTIAFDGPVEFVKAQPNGSPCPPTCFAGSVRLTDAGTLVAVPGASLSSVP